MSDEIAQRPLRWWDVERLLPLEQQLFGGQAWSAETWWGELARVGDSDPARWYVVAESDGDIVGYAGLSVNGSEADVMTVAVSPASQGQRLGSRLLDALLDTARARSVTQVMLEVRADNDAALRLYRKRGFEQVAVRRGYYGDTDGVIMRLRPLRPRPEGAQRGPVEPRS